MGPISIEYVNDNIIFIITSIILLRSIIWLLFGLIFGISKDISYGDG